MIGFPRGAGLMYERYATETGVDAVGLDTGVPPAYARERTCNSGWRCKAISIPFCCWSAASRCVRRSRNCAQTLGGGPYIFNLGHGVLPDTPLEHVAELARLLNG